MGLMSADDFVMDTGGYGPIAGAIPSGQLRRMLAYANPKIHRFIKQFAKKPKATTGAKHNYSQEFYVMFRTYESARSAFESFVNRNINKVKASANSAKYYFPDRSVMTVKFKSNVFRRLKGEAARPGVTIKYDKRPSTSKPKTRPEPEVEPDQNIYPPQTYW